MSTAKLPFKSDRPDHFAPRDLCVANRGRHCNFGSAGECRDCGRHRAGAPALGFIPESSDAQRLEVEI